MHRQLTRLARRCGGRNQLTLTGSKLAPCCHGNAITEERRAVDERIRNRQLVTVCHPHTPLQRNVTLPLLSTNGNEYATPFGTRSFWRFPRLGSESKGDTHDSDGKKLTLVQRFKESYKQYGKVLIGVHAATSAVWFGGFYYAASNGLDVVPWLESWNFSDTMIKPFRSSVGNVAVAYLLYKLATPARYTVTILGTRYTARYMTKMGYLEPVPESNKLKSLMKEGRSQAKEKYSDMKDDFKGKYGDMKDDIKEKYGDMKDDIKEKYGDMKDDVKDKYGGMKDDIKEKLKDKKVKAQKRLKKQS